VPSETKPERRTQRQRSEATTRDLLEAARELFARDGYGATSLEAVAAEANVTKGALYHHFAGKRELFEAVFEEEERRLCAALADVHARHADPVEAAYQGCRAFLDASLDPAVQRITLIDAPSVLGWQRLREIEARYGLVMIKEGLHKAAVASGAPDRDVDPAAHLLFGALCEGAMFLATAEDPASAKRKLETELESLLRAFAG
jgi:AcrR family transcriptional regulator